jgi:CRISPR-associated protein Csb3
MNHPTPNITVHVDVTNPGQYFACCGLLELANRLWPGAEGWFDEPESTFRIACDGDMSALMSNISSAPLEPLDPDNQTSSPLHLGDPFELDLNWWHDELAGGKALKVWAGSMRCVRIARAMQAEISNLPDPMNPFEYGAPVYDPDNPSKKVEPFYFDSRRGWNAQSIDLGFSPDAFSMTTEAHPAVEFLCLVGLQRFRPAPTKSRRVFEYQTWSAPLAVELAMAAAAGTLGHLAMQAYRFENAFRTDQKKHKSFLPATPIGGQS